MIGHVALAFISRSESQGLFAMGALGNRIMNLWALGAMLFLLAGMYIPGLQARFFLQPLPLWELALVAIVAIAITGVAELAKRWGGRKQTVSVSPGAS
jgi:Ca2+-transporting ATPase